MRAAPYHPIYGESLLNLRAGQRISVRDLLYGLILRSGNDAAYDLARAAAGSEGRFVRQMNRTRRRSRPRRHPLRQPDRPRRARQLLQRRRSLDPHRAPAPHTRSSPGSPTSRSARLRSLRPQRRITTINELLEMAPWVTGVKTGHTFDAGYVLVGSGRRKGVELIAVVIGAPTDEARFDGDSEAARLRLLAVPPPCARARRAGARRTVDPLLGRRPAAARRPHRRGRRLSAASGVDVDVHARRRGRGPDRPRRGRWAAATVLVDGRPAARSALRAGRSIPAASSLRPGARLRRGTHDFWPCSACS